MEQESSKNYGPRVASYISVLGWLDLLGLNLGGLILLWFAAELRKKSNGFRKATIAYLGLDIVVPVALLLKMLFDPANPPKMTWFGGDIHISPIVSIAFILAVAVVHLVPVIWLLSPGTRAAFERRAERGLCVRCGYDLRASENRCPECGEPISRPSVDITNP